MLTFLVLLPLQQNIFSIDKKLYFLSNQKLEIRINYLFIPGKTEVSYDKPNRQLVDL